MKKQGVFFCYFFGQAKKYKRHKAEINDLLLKVPFYQKIT
jgi:hypothetical protein